MRCCTRNAIPQVSDLSAIFEDQRNLMQFTLFHRVNIVNLPKIMQKVELLLENYEFDEILLYVINESILSLVFLYVVNAATPSVVHKTFINFSFLRSFSLMKQFVINVSNCRPDHDAITQFLQICSLIFCKEATFLKIWSAIF